MNRRGWSASLARRIAACTACPRLAAYVGSFRRRTGYWAQPVPGFGDPRARLVLVGLAPGAHGANRTGRPFTGDAAGELLYRALHAHGFASAPVSRSRRDRLTLEDAWISNVLRCAPPGNRPRGDELARCAGWLEEELAGLDRLQVLVALGRIAHDGLLRWARSRGLVERLGDHPFGHGRRHSLGAGPVLIDSYHPSRYNVNVGKLDYAGFSRVVGRARRALERG